MTTTPGGSSDPAHARSNELLVQLIDSVTDYAIFALDPLGIVTTWNPGAQRLTGGRT